MKRVYQWVLFQEISAAVHLGAVARMWSASAVRRIRKLSGETSAANPLK